MRQSSHVACGGVIQRVQRHVQSHYIHFWNMSWSVDDSVSVS